MPGFCESCFGFFAADLNQFMGYSKIR